MSPERISLGEGNTPLVRSHRIGPALGFNRLYFKLESLNPTGSYKDRFAAAAINDMVRDGITRMVGSSSGNAGSSVAAYCAATGIECQIAIVQDAPEGKLKQMLAYGAKLWKIYDFGLDAKVTEQVLAHLRELGQRPNCRLQVSAYKHSPVGMAGVESLGHELTEQAKELGREIDHVFSCAGSGGLIVALVKGFETALANQRLSRLPKVHCVQPSGNDTIAGPLRNGEANARSCSRAFTRISGLQVPNLIDGEEAFAACRRAEGTGFLVEDDETFELQRRLAREEGIFCEPAGAVALAGAIRALREGTVSPDDTIVCLVTGAGFKDPASVDRMLANSTCPTISLQEFQNLT